MITFSDEASRALLSELKEAALVTPIVTEAVNRRLGPEACPTIEEFLLAAAEVIDERAWLYWIIRHYDCCRFGPVELAAEAASWANAVPARGTALPANLPYLHLEDGTRVFALLRPDLAVQGYRGAATLRELAALQRTWESVRV